MIPAFLPHVFGGPTHEVGLLADGVGGRTFSLKSFTYVTAARAYKAKHSKSFSRSVVDDTAEDCDHYFLLFNPLKLIIFELMTEAGQPLIGFDSQLASRL